VVPVTKVTKDDIEQMEKYPERNEAYIAIKMVLAYYYDDMIWQNIARYGKALCKYIGRPHT